MGLVEGTQIGPYEVAGPLGAGGMGEVYRARDTRLRRDVALKLLPEAFARDADRLARFEREAHVLASLNHPNIAQVYGLEDTGSTRAIVMELVEGPTLGDLILGQGHRAPAAGAPAGRRAAASGGHTPRAMEIGDAIAIAAQIASALEAAHEQGIVHRDLKPANVKVKEDGTVKVLDFGLARAMGPESARASAGASTVTSPAMTEIGMLLGTAGYMSPEQARGKTVDKRADIWAFGVVLYEMIAGERLFAGDSVSETVAAVLKDEVRLDRLPADAPPAIRRLLARCLDRDPKQRLRDIGEARIILSQPAETDSDRQTRPAAPASRARIVVATTIGVIALAIVAGFLAWHFKPAVAVPVRRLELPAAMAAADSLELSPDGSRIAYFAGGHLYVRALDALDARDLGLFPISSGQLFWSPDSRTVAFMSEGAIRSVPADGGSVFELCRIPATGRILAGSWRQDGTVLFAVWRDSLYAVPAGGGTPTIYQAVDPKTEVDFHSVTALPDNRLVVTTHIRREANEFRIELLGARPGAERRVILEDPSIAAAIVAPSGHLLFGREGTNAGVWTAPFNGAPIAIADLRPVAPGARGFNVAHDGTLLLRVDAAGPKSELVWVDRAGTVSPIAGEPFDRASGATLSPDGRRAAFLVGPEANPQLVVRNLETGADTHLTFADAGGRREPVVAKAPTWTPAGDEVLYTVGTVEAMHIVIQRADGVGGPRPLTAGMSGRMTPDRRSLVFILDDRGAGHLRAAPIRPDGSPGPPEHVFQDIDPRINSFDISPNGSLLAYAVVQADAMFNVYLTQFPSGAGRWQVTTTGGTRPRFSRDGKELFYQTGTTSGTGLPHGLLMAMSVTSEPQVQLGLPATVLEEGQPPVGLSFASFETAPNKRLLMTRSVTTPAGAVTRLVLVQNWLAAVPR